MADIGSTLGQLGGDSNSIEAGQIIDLSNLNFKVTEVDTRVRMEEARVRVLEGRLRQSEQVTQQIEARAHHLGKYLIKQQARMAGMMLVGSVVEDMDLPIGARGIVNIGMQGVYGAMYTPGAPMVGAAVGMTYGIVHELWHALREHEMEMIRIKKVQKEEHDARVELEQTFERRTLELVTQFDGKLRTALDRQEEADNETEYQTAVLVED